ncbi:MAG: hypothetical protein H7221_08070 [Flavobacterium sp.]|nr:hypothetical protein [Flavobacterium sp.]
MRKIVKAIIVVFGILVALYLYLFQGHREISTETAQYAVSAQILNDEFKISAAKANKKYLDKTIQLSGKLTFYDAKAKNLIIDNNVFATFLINDKTAPKMGSTINIKGRFIGYDDLLEQYKIDQITIVE